MRIKLLLCLSLIAALGAAACKPGAGSQILGMKAQDYYSQFGYAKTGSADAPHYHYMTAQGVNIQNYPDGRKVVANISIFILPRFQFVLGYDELVVCADGKTITAVSKKTDKGQATVYGTSIKFGDVAAALADSAHPDTTINVQFVKNMISDGLKRMTVPFTLADSTSPMADVLAQKYTVAPNGAAACASPSASPATSPRVSPTGSPMQTTTDGQTATAN